MYRCVCPRGAPRQPGVPPRRGQERWPSDGRPNGGVNKVDDPLAGDNAGPHPCERMRADPIFQRLLAVVRAEIREGFERQALSHHTTASCRRDDGAPAQSLKAAGIDIAIDTASGVRVHLSMPNLMEASDSIRVEYETANCASHAAAKLLVVQEYLCLLLGVQPNMVRLPPKCSKDGRPRCHARGTPSRAYS